MNLMNMNDVRGGAIEGGVGELGIGSNSRKRLLQKVSTISKVKWMIQDANENGEKGVVLHTINQFRSEFRGKYNANHMKCTGWWKSRAELDALDKFNSKSLSTVTMSDRTQRIIKAVAGSGRGRAQWVEKLYDILLGEFSRFKATGVKFSPALIVVIARDIILTSAEFAVDFGAMYVDPVDGIKVIDKVKTRWVQQFTEANGIVTRMQTGKLLCSPEKEAHIEMSVAYHMGEMHRGFKSGELCEDLIYNMDETHFVINFDNGRTLGFRGDEEVKYADVVSGGEGMTMIVHITGGATSCIDTPMLIFQNVKRSYPIQGLSDTVPGVAYRTVPKGSNDKTVFPTWFLERRVYTGDLHGREIIMYLDNCGGHNESENLTATLAQTNTKLAYFPPCSTHLIQPCDSFVMSKIKDEWTKLWEEEKMQMIREDEWSNAMRRDGAWSGKQESDFSS